MATNDSALRDRSLIQLAVQKQSIGSYMLYRPDNNVEPKQFIGNWVSGIRWENKIDHVSLIVLRMLIVTFMLTLQTTYFGANEEYIHGIHMLPITPISSFISIQRNNSSLFHTDIPRNSRICEERMVFQAEGPRAYQA